MSIAVSISATQTHTPDVDQSPFTVADIDFSGRGPRRPTLDDNGIDLLVTSLWQERTSCRFPVTLAGINRADYSTFQVLTTSHAEIMLSCGLLLSQLFTEGLLQKPPCSAMTSADWFYCRDVTRRGYVVFRSLLRTFVYAAKQACALNTTRFLKSQPSNVASQIQRSRLS